MKHQVEWEQNVAVVLHDGKILNCFIYIEAAEKRKKIYIYSKALRLLNDPVSKTGSQACFGRIN